MSGVQKLTLDQLKDRFGSGCSLKEGAIYNDKDGTPSFRLVAVSRDGFYYIDEINASSSPLFPEHPAIKFAKTFAKIGNTALSASDVKLKGIQPVDLAMRATVPPNYLVDVVEQRIKKSSIAEAGLTRSKLPPCRVSLLIIIAYHALQKMAASPAALKGMDPYQGLFESDSKIDRICRVVVNYDKEHELAKIVTNIEPEDLRTIAINQYLNLPINQLCPKLKSFKDIVPVNSAFFDHLHQSS